MSAFRLTEIHVAERRGSVAHTAAADAAAAKRRAMIFQPADGPEDDGGQQDDDTADILQLVMSRSSAGFSAMEASMSAHHQSVTTTAMRYQLISLTFPGRVLRDNDPDGNPGDRLAESLYVPVDVSVMQTAFEKVLQSDPTLKFNRMVNSLAHQPCFLDISLCVFWLAAMRAQLHVLQKRWESAISRGEPPMFAAEAYERARVAFSLVEHDCFHVTAMHFGGTLLPKLRHRARKDVATAPTTTASSSSSQTFTAATSLNESFTFVDNILRLLPRLLSQGAFFVLTATFRTTEDACCFEYDFRRWLLAATTQWYFGSYVPQNIALVADAPWLTFTRKQRATEKPKFDGAQLERQLEGAAYDALGTKLLMEAADLGAPGGVRVAPFHATGGTLRFGSSTKPATSTAAARNDSFASLTGGAGATNNTSESSPRDTELFATPGAVADVSPPLEPGLTLERMPSFATTTAASTATSRPARGGNTTIALVRPPPAWVGATFSVTGGGHARVLAAVGDGPASVSRRGSSMSQLSRQLGSRTGSSLGGTRAAVSTGVGPSTALTSSSATHRSVVPILQLRDQRGAWFEQGRSRGTLCLQRVNEVEEAKTAASNAPWRATSTAPTVVSEEDAFEVLDALFDPSSTLFGSDPSPASSRGGGLLEGNAASPSLRSRGGPRPPANRGSMKEGAGNTLIEVVPPSDRKPPLTSRPTTTRSLEGCALPAPVSSTRQHRGSDSAAAFRRYLGGSRDDDSAARAPSSAHSQWSSGQVAPLPTALLSTAATTTNATGVSTLSPNFAAPPEAPFRALDELSPLLEYYCSTQGIDVQRPVPGVTKWTSLSTMDKSATTLNFSALSAPILSHAAASIREERQVLTTIIERDRRELVTSQRAFRHALGRARVAASMIESLHSRRHPATVEIVNRLKQALKTALMKGRSVNRISGGGTHITEALTALRQALRSLQQYSVHLPRTDRADLDVVGMRCAVLYRALHRSQVLFGGDDDPQQQQGEGGDREQAAVPWTLAANASDPPLSPSDREALNRLTGYCIHALQQMQGQQRFAENLGKRGYPVSMLGLKRGTGGVAPSPTLLPESTTSLSGNPVVFVVPVLRSEASADESAEPLLPLADPSVSPLPPLLPSSPAAAGGGGGPRGGRGDDAAWRRRASSVVAIDAPSDDADRRQRSRQRGGSSSPLLMQRVPNPYESYRSEKAPAAAVPVALAGAATTTGKGSLASSAPSPTKRKVSIAFGMRDVDEAELESQRQALALEDDLNTLLLLSKASADRHERKLMATLTLQASQLASANAVDAAAAAADGAASPSSGGGTARRNDENMSEPAASSSSLKALSASRLTAASSGEPSGDSAKPPPKELPAVVTKTPSNPLLRRRRSSRRGSFAVLSATFGGGNGRQQDEDEAMNLQDPADAAGPFASQRHDEHDDDSPSRQGGSRSRSDSRLSMSTDDAVDLAALGRGDKALPAPDGDGRGDSSECSSSLTSLHSRGKGGGSSRHETTSSSASKKVPFAVADERRVTLTTTTAACALGDVPVVTSRRTSSLPTAPPLPTAGTMPAPVPTAPHVPLEGSPAFSPTVPRDSNPRSATATRGMTTPRFQLSLSKRHTIAPNSVSHDHRRQ